MNPAVALGAGIVAEQGWLAHRGVHRILDDYLERLAGCLGEPLQACMVALVLRRGLFAHLKYEEDWVLPLYRGAVAAPPANATTEVFAEDHRLLRDRLDRLLDLCLAVAMEPRGAPLLREALAVLDDLLHHHDQRETELLYPALEQALDAAARSALLGRLAEVPLLPAARAVETAERWSAEGVLRQWSALYRGWRQGDLLLGGEVPPLPAAAARLEPARRGALEKLWRRDLDLVAGYARSSFGSPRERNREERKVEQTLRSTVRFALEALLEDGTP